MNAGHQRRVASTCQHVEALLRKAEAILAGEESQPPFGQVVYDLRREHQEIFQDYAGQVRRLLRATLARFGIPLPDPSIPASRSIYVHLIGAEIDLEELGGTRLEGYGHLPPEESRALALANQEVLGVLKDLRRFFTPVEADGGLAAAHPSGRPGPVAPPRQEGQP